MLTPVFYLDKISSESIFIIKNIFEKKNFKIAKDIENSDIVITKNKDLSSNKIQIVIDDNIISINKDGSYFKNRW